MTNSSIQELILRIQIDEDITAFNQVYGLYVVKLPGFAYSFLDDKEPAEEIVSDVFLNIWTGRKKLDPLRSLQVYLYVSVKNACLNHLRSVFSKRDKELKLAEACYFHLSVDPAQLLISKELSTSIGLHDPWEWKWVNQHDNAYPAKPTGNSPGKSAELYKKYNQIIREAYAN